MFSLQANDKVGIISPSAALENTDINQALAYLCSQQLTPVLGKYVHEQYRYMAGTDKQRAEDIMTFFEDDRIKALFCTRGGAGSLRLLPLLDYDVIRRHPKPIFGLSDSTALQNGIYAQTTNISYSGFLLAYDFKDGQINQMQHQDLQDIFSGRPLHYTSGKTVNEGTSEGVLVGGNAMVFLSLCGTPYFPDLSGKILLLEDVGIKSYQLDLMLHQLKQQASFEKLRGIIFGQFTNIKIADACDGSIDENIALFAREINKPVIKDFAYGHIPARHILPIGGYVKLDAKSCEVSTLPLTDN